jgi:2-(acetamidomethylene)succinate hydrolase
VLPGKRLQTAAAGLYAIELGEGPPLLFLHGVTANAYVWQPVLELLAGSYHCVAIDQRGHGRSGRPPDGRFDAAAYAGDAADVAALIGGGRAVIVGHSLGARNAIVAGAMRPGAVAGVVAIEFTPFIEQAAFDALDARVGGAPASFASAGDLTGYLSSRYIRLPQDAVARRAAHGFAARPDGSLAPLADAAAMRETCTGLREDLAPGLRRLAVPAVLVRGADSTFVSAAAFRAARALRPDLPGIVVGGADHYLPEEKPAETARIISEFAAGSLTAAAAASTEGGPGD